jgi:ABC-type phosphate transport system substrate-binding protein
MLKKIFIVTLLICFNSFGEEILIIGNKGLPTDHLSLHEIKLIYLKKKLFIKNVKVVPVNLSPFNPLRKEFNRYVLRMDNEQLVLYWNTMYFNGIDPPVVLSSQRAVVEFVSKVKGGIGYITPKYLNKKVKVLLRVKTNE